MTIFDVSPRTTDLHARLSTFMDEYIYPNEAEFQRELAANTAAGQRWTPLKLLARLKEASARDSRFADLAARLLHLPSRPGPHL